MDLDAFQRFHDLNDVITEFVQCFAVINAEDLDILAKTRAL